MAPTSAEKVAVLRGPASAILSETDPAQEAELRHWQGSRYLLQVESFGGDKGLANGLETRVRDGGLRKQEWVPFGELYSTRWGTLFVLPYPKTWVSVA